MDAVDMALDAALLIVQNGGSTAAAERAFAHVLTGCGKEGVTAVWRFDFVAVEAHAGSGSSAVIRRVGMTGVNLSRASEAMALAERLAHRAITAADFRAALERVKTLPSPYSRWGTMGAAACTAGGFSQVAGGDWGSLGIAFVAAAIGQALRSRLQARKVPVAGVTLVCAVLSALIASAGLRLGYSGAPSIALIASVIYMFPGLPLINGFIDLASYRFVLVGMERVLYAAFLFLMLAVAIAFAQTLVL